MMIPMIHMEAPAKTLPEGPARSPIHEPDIESIPFIAPTPDDVPKYGDDDEGPTTCNLAHTSFLLRK